MTIVAKAHTAQTKEQILIRLLCGDTPAISQNEARILMGMDTKTEWNSYISVPGDVVNFLKKEWEAARLKAYSKRDVYPIEYPKGYRTDRKTYWVEWGIAHNWDEFLDAEVGNNQ